MQILRWRSGWPPQREPWWSRLLACGWRRMMERRTSACRILAALAVLTSRAHAQSTSSRPPLSALRPSGALPPPVREWCPNHAWKWYLHSLRPAVRRRRHMRLRRVQLRRGAVHPARDGGLCRLSSRILVRSHLRYSSSWLLLAPPLRAQHTPDADKRLPHAAAPAELRRRSPAHRAHSRRALAARAAPTAPAALLGTLRPLRGRRAARRAPRVRPARQPLTSPQRAPLAPTRSRVPRHARLAQPVSTAPCPRQCHRPALRARTLRVAPHLARTARLVRSARRLTKRRLRAGPTKCRPTTQ